MKRIRNLFLVFSFFLLTMIPVSAKEKVTLYLFHGDGCPHCAEEKDFLKDLQKDNPDLKVVTYEVWYDEDNAEFLKKVQEKMNITTEGVPVTIIGDSVFIGYESSVGQKIRRAVSYYQEQNYIDQVKRIREDAFVIEEFHPDSGFTEEEKKRDDDMSIQLPLFGKIHLKDVSLTSAAVVIGLVDGFNPCAMWILLFLISILIGMKDRKRMWTIGITFLLTSGLVYMLIMLSWIQIAVKMTSIVFLRNMIAIVAIIGAIINLRQFINSRDDSGCEVVDDKKRKKIFKKIKKFTHEKNLLIALVGVVGLAVSVNLVELACSAGLPLVFSELLVLNQVSSVQKFTYTLLYILFFLLDDFIVFFIAMFTMKLTGISTKYNKYSHLIGGIIMLVIGILLLVRPEWLMFHFK